MLTGLSKAQACPDVKRPEPASIEAKASEAPNLLDAAAGASVLSDIGAGSVSGAYFAAKYLGY